LLFPFPRDELIVIFWEKKTRILGQYISALSVLILLENQLMLINTCNALNAVQSVGRRGHIRKLFFNIHHSRPGQTNPQVIIVSSDFY
jgi:hypothetical protein